MSVEFLSDGRVVPKLQQLLSGCLLFEGLIVFNFARWQTIKREGSVFLKGYR